MRHEATGINVWHLLDKRFTLKMCTQFPQAGEEFVLTIRNPAVIEGKKGLGVSYEAFVDDVQVCHKRTPFHETLLPALSLLFLKNHISSLPQQPA